MDDEDDISSPMLSINLFFAASLGLLKLTGGFFIAFSMPCSIPAENMFFDFHNVIKLITFSCFSASWPTYAVANNACK